MKRKNGWLQRHEKFINEKTEMMMPAPRGLLRNPEPEPVTAFICGTCEHAWDGQAYEDETTSTATCSKCGMRQIDHDMMVEP